eukprot:jgi/Mesen1/3574/ME000002S05142
MVVLAAVRDYVTRMLNEVSGMKILLVDKETLGIVSLALSQSEILHKEVFLVENVDATSRDVMSHLKAVYFLRPTVDSINHLKRHLAQPRFGEYHIYFSNILSNSSIHILADADEHCVVRQLQEYYGDVLALDPYLFNLNLANNYCCYMLAGHDSHPGMQAVVDRSVEALSAVFLALKKRPVIRFQRASDICKRIAINTGKLMYEQEKPLFDFRRSESAPLLLIIDRRDDAVTPLLNQWTYQAMVHELLGLHNNRVDLRHLPHVSQDQKEVVLSQTQDEFFRANMYDNFGDVGANIAKMVDELQKADKRNKGLHTLEDMAAVLESYPEYRKQAGNVSKHVTLMTELQRAVDARQLMALSQTEQELACSSGQAAAFEIVMSQLNQEEGKVADVDRLRLVMLYALRYEKENPRLLEALMAKLASRPTKLKPGLVYTLLRHCGADKRVGDLFGNRDLFNMMARNGVENVYTQHQPLLAQTVESAVKGRLRDTDYPFAGNHFQQGRPQEVVIFIVGGTTYEEARTVALHNSSSSANAGGSTRVILGGTSLLNSTSFLSDLWEVNQVDSRTDLDQLT